MNIKTFQAEDVQVAMEMIKAEFGHDAVILSTRRQKRKDPHTGRITPVVDVVAAIDFDIDELKPSANRKKRPSPVTQSSDDWIISHRLTQTHTDHPINQSQAAPQDIANLSREIDSLKVLLDQALCAVNMDGFRRNSHSHSPHTIIGRSSPLLVIQQVFSLIGIEPLLQQALAQRFLAHVDNKTIVTHDLVMAWLRDYGLRRIRIGPIAERSKSPCWWAIIGPTGVGKTTTLAKLAARLKFQRGLNGLLITVDTYRLGGVEQIRKYADLMDIPLKLAGDSHTLMKIFADNKDKDFILVDTTGRSLRDPRHHTELRKLFETIPGLKGQVLLCATAKAEDVKDSIKCYSRVPVVGWILSKVDETSTYGPLCTPVIGQELPISYITDGQRVPEDIAPASARNLVSMLLHPEPGPAGTLELPSKSTTKRLLSNACDIARVN